MHDTAGHNRRSVATMEVAGRGKEAEVKTAGTRGEVVVKGAGRGAKLGDWGLE